MKYIVIILSILFVGCSPYQFNMCDYESPELPLMEAWRKTAAFSYIPDEEPYLKSPKQFEEDGGGNCGDFSVYMIYLLGPEASFVLFDQNGTNHAIVMYRDEFLEPQMVNYRYRLKEGTYSVRSYDDIMSYATGWGMY